MKIHPGKFLLFTAFAYIAVRSCMEFHQIAWGTGTWLGEYSFKWGMLFFIYIIFCIMLAILTGFALWRAEKTQSLFKLPIKLREKMGALRWIPALLILIAPVWFLQYTPWGVVFRDNFIRFMIWGLVVFAFAFLISKENKIIGWHEFLAALLLTSSEFIIAASFIDVTNYPFSLGWSEGNRMWDYSMLFAKHLYDIPAGQSAEVLLDLGRQFIGGVPFIIPNLSIEMERAWLATTIILPYLLLGFAAFHFDRANFKVWFLASLWVLIFLKQGPIHPPLVLCAAVVALLWKKPLWISLPLIAVTSYLAWASRFTWLFAPGMWIGMLELASAALQNKQLGKSAWLRALSLGLTGMAAGLLGPQFINLIPQSSINTAVTLESTSEMASVQSLLWYRLLPNATYGVGIVVGLLIAVLPLIFILLYLAREKKWQINIWQAAAIVAPLSAFLVVGLIVSAKIGGGGDLHNMDMFLIGLMFAGALAWYNGGREWIQNSGAINATMKIIIVLFLIIPALSSLRQLRSHHFGEDTGWLITLTDAPDEKSLGMLPTQETVDKALQKIQVEVSRAKQEGEVLFIDQRQLLTFGYIKDVPFIPAYEKKVLINEALSANAKYFAPFYADLAAQRFSLIVSQPLHENVQDSADSFGEENNAWVKWVSTPILCYYEEKITVKEVGVQLLVPTTTPIDCSSQIPQEN